MLLYVSSKYLDICSWVLRKMNHRSKSFVQKNIWGKSAQGAWPAEDVSKLSCKNEGGLRTALFCFLWAVQLFAHTQCF